MSRTLRTLVVDDEHLARLRLRTLLADVQMPQTPAAEVAAEVVAEAADAGAALQWLTDHPDGCDLLLLDIRMPGRDGLQLAAAVRALPLPPAVVFVTAHGHHALKAFDLDAVDYLTKPVSRDRLAAALQRVQQRRWPLDSQPSPLADTPMLVVSDRGRVLRVPLADVLVLKAEQKYVTLRTAQASHLLDDSLTDLERRVGPGFLRIHRNALVAAQAVRELRRHAGDDGDEGWAVRVAPIDEWLPVSRRQLAAVREALASRV